jgi:hypothetical protein
MSYLQVSENSVEQVMYAVCITLYFLKVIYAFCHNYISNNKVQSLEIAGFKRLLLKGTVIFFALFLINFILFSYTNFCVPFLNSLKSSVKH